jgi:uncharacterized membrane protein YvlD (DUF360 family)
MTVKCQKVNQKRKLRLEKNRQVYIYLPRKKQKNLLLKKMTMKIIKQFIITIIINAVLLYVIANHIPELWFKITSVYQDTLIIFWALGVGFRIINSLLRSILKALTLPIKYLTLGISWLIINILLLYIFEQFINYSDIGITVSLGTLSQTFILSLIVTVIHLIVKKIV